MLTMQKAPSLSSKNHSGLCELGTNINGLYGANVYNAAYCNSHYEVNGDDVAAGYNLGFHGDLGSTKLALVYHSEVKYTLKGDSEITNTPITGANVAGNPKLYRGRCKLASHQFSNWQTGIEQLPVRAKQTGFNHSCQYGV